MASPGTSTLGTADGVAVGSWDATTVDMSVGISTSAIAWAVGGSCR